MNTPDASGSQSVAGHTLANLGRLDKRTDGLEKKMVRVVELLGGLDLKMDRSSRDSREGLIRIERDLNEIRSDAILSDNKILDRLGETLSPSQRSNRNDERLDELEKALGFRAGDQGTRS